MEPNSDDNPVDDPLGLYDKFVSGAKFGAIVGILAFIAVALAN